VKLRMMALLMVTCLLTGCASLLEREYSTSEPHSSKFWESEAAGTLRAENYQDVVNDLLLLIGQRRETATLRLYNFSDDLAVTDILERAAVEIQQETPMGAYAVEYITFYNEAQRGYYEAQIQIGYRRTAEQVQAVINATSPEALYSLLGATLDSDRNELAVRIAYWGQDGRTRVEDTVEQLRIDRGLEETPGWTINYYPEEGTTGLVEVFLDVPPEPVEEMIPQEEEATSGESEGTDGEAVTTETAENGEQLQPEDNSVSEPVQQEPAEKTSENLEQKG